MNRSVLGWVGAGTVLLLGGLAWFAWLPAPRASALFSQGISVSPTGYDSYDQRVAVDRQGDAALVWVRKSRAYPYTWRVQFRSRSHTGAWGSTINVSPSGQAPRSPKVVVDDDGDAVVVWDAYTGTDYHVYARRVSRTGALGTLRVLTPGGVSIHGTDVAVDPDGDAVVTWAEWHSTGATFPMMRRYSRSGTLSAPVVLASSPARADPPAVALDRQGDAVLAWANDWLVQARTLSASGTLGPLRTVSPDLSPIDRHFVARVTIDRDGDALVTWEHWTAADLSTQIWVRRGPEHPDLGPLDFPRRGRRRGPAAHPLLAHGLVELLGFERPRRRCDADLGPVPEREPVRPPDQPHGDDRPAGPGDLIWPAPQRAHRRRR